MSETYYERRDLDDFPDIGEYAHTAGVKFFDYYTAAAGAGNLTEREKALKAGDTAPMFSLPNSEGIIVESQVLLRKGPLVIHFYRGK